MRGPRRGSGDSDHGERDGRGRQQQQQQSALHVEGGRSVASAYNLGTSPRVSHNAPCTTTKYLP